MRLSLRSKLARSRRLVPAHLALPLLLTACGGAPLPAPKAQAPAATMTAASRTYSLTTPPSWQRTEGGEFEKFTDPDGAVWAYFSEVRIDGEDTASLDAAIAAFIEARHPGMNLKLRQALDGSVNERFSAQRILTYIDDGNTEAAQGIAMRHSKHPERVYLALVEGPVKGLNKRQSELTQLMTSLEIEGAARIVLKAEDLKPFDEARRAALYAFVEKARVMAEVPGVALAVVTPEGVFTKGFGQTAEGGAPVTAKTRMMIGSITKSFSTMLLGTLVDDGKLRWDMPVTEAKPDFALADARGSKLEIKHLFCACVGAPRQDMELLFRFAERQPEMVFDEIKALKLTTALGETFQYNNQLTAAGGYIAGQVAHPEMADVGAAYAAALQARVLDPIGMTETTLSQEKIATLPHGAPHRQGWAGTVALDPALERFVEPYAPAGALWSTADDMAKYMQTQLAKGVAPNGQRVISEANLSRTWTPQVPVSDKAGYGMGWITGESQGLKATGHGGATMGFNADLTFYPELGVGIFVVANRSAAGVLGPIRNRLFELLFDQPEKAEQNFTKRLEQIKAIHAASAEKVSKLPVPEALLGRYESPRLGPLTISKTPEGVQIDAGEWQGGLAVNDPEDRAETLIITSGVMQGMTMQYTLSEGAPRLILRHAQSDYVFEHK